MRAPLLLCCVVFTCPTPSSTNELVAMVCAEPSYMYLQTRDTYGNVRCLKLGNDTLELSVWVSSSSPPSDNAMICGPGPPGHDTFHTGDNSPFSHGNSSCNDGDNFKLSWKWTSTNCNAEWDNLGKRDEKYPDAHGCYEVAFS